jgi:hypothetical protein
MKERPDQTQFTTKIARKTSLGPNYAFDALLCQNWWFLPPNRVTLWITLLSIVFVDVDEL